MGCWIRTSHHPDGRFLRSLARASVALIDRLMVVGGIVRVTGSGLGCPDWPLCDGQWIPQVRAEARIEYPHRPIWRLYRCSGAYLTLLFLGLMVQALL